MITISNESIRAFEEAIQLVAGTVLELSEYLYQCAEDAYLLHHRRLPGSYRTKRLRKKRRTRVLRWFTNWIESQ